MNSLTGLKAESPKAGCGQGYDGSEVQRESVPCSFHLLAALGFPGAAPPRPCPSPQALRPGASAVCLSWGHVSVRSRDCLGDARRLHLRIPNCVCRLFLQVMTLWAVPKLGHEMAPRIAFYRRSPSVCSLTDKAHPPSRHLCFVVQTLASHQFAVNGSRHEGRLIQATAHSRRKHTRFFFSPAEHLTLIFKIFIGVSLLHDVLVSAVQSKVNQLPVYTYLLLLDFLPI